MAERRHLHIHIVPRAEGDGLPLPWTERPAGSAALADFHPDDGHRHLCARRGGCVCAAELYTLAARLDETQRALVQRASDAVAAAHGVRGHSYPPQRRRGRADASTLAASYRPAFNPDTIRGEVPDE